jgi:gliding motility-associated-like protein
MLDGIEEQPGTEFAVFDRKGVLVYKSDNYKNEWNGIDFKGRTLPDDTYFFVLKPRTGRNRSGFIVLRH